MSKHRKGSAAADAAAEAKSVFDVRLRADERSGIMGKATQKEPGCVLVKRCSVIRHLIYLPHLLWC